MELRIESLFFPAGFQPFHGRRPFPPASFIQMPAGQSSGKQKQEQIGAFGEPAAVPGGLDDDRQGFDRTGISRDNILVSYVQPVFPGILFREQDLRRGFHPSVLRLFDLVEIDIIAAVDVVEGDYTHIVEPFTGTDDQRTVFADRIFERNQPVVDPHAPEKQFGIERFGLVAGLLHNDESVGSPEEQRIAPRVLIGGPVAVFNGVYPVRIPVFRLVGGLRVVPYEPAVRSKEEFSFAVFEYPVNDIADGSFPHGSVVFKLEQSPTRPDPEFPVFGTKDSPDIVGYLRPRVVERGDGTSVAVGKVMDQPASAIADPERMVHIFEQGEKEVLILQRFPEIQFLPLPDIRNTALVADNQPEDAAPHRSDPQRIPVALPNGVHITQVRRHISAQRPDFVPGE